MASHQKSIGGFFELEISNARTNYHLKALGLSNGRACLNVILRQIKPVNIYVPYYCCDSLLDPFIVNDIKYSFYSINDKFEPLYLPDIQEGEFFLYINYFGLKGDCVKKLVGYYKNRIIIDNTHGYFEKGYGKGWSFNSCRKFFGVPDGAYLYSLQDIDIIYPRNKNFIVDHLILRLDGRQQEAFSAYQKNEALQDCVPFQISRFSETILKSIDYDLVAAKRRTNFNLYHEQLKLLNELSDIDLKGDSIPYCYPFLIKRNIDLTHFYKRGLFIPALWKEVATRDHSGFSHEKKISQNILPLPVDHRYNHEDLQFVINTLKEII